MSVPLQQMLEELRKAEQARDLISEVERRLSAGNADLENLARVRSHKAVYRRGRRGCQDWRFDQSRL
jgi:hypothetical protein